MLGTLRVGILSEQGFVSILDNEYYEGVLSHANQKITSYTYPTGIDPRVIEGVITIEDVESDVTGIIKAAFAGEEHKPDLTDINARLTANVSSFLLEGSVEVADDSKEVIAAFATEVTDIYLQAMKMPGLDSIVKVRNACLSPLSLALVICVVLAGALVATICSLHHFLHRSLRFISYATGGASLMCLVGPLVVYVSKSYEHLMLEPQYFYHFGVSVALRALTLVMAGGLLLAVATVLLIVLVARMRESVIHRHSHRHHSHSE